MDNSSIEDTLEQVLEEFRSGIENPEEGLDVDEPSLLQLRKACRLLEAAHLLQRQDGYYTVIIEASFAAIERTIQYYLLDNSYIHEDEFVDHTKVYEMGETAGLYRNEFKDKLIHLWKNNRSRTYYREGIGTRSRAQLMLQLASEIHGHILQLSGEKHECVCQTR